MVVVGGTNMYAKFYQNLRLQDLVGMLVSPGVVDEE
jgi:hypothetical protein